MRNTSGCLILSVDLYVQLSIFSDGVYFAPLFTHAPPTAAHFPVVSPSYSELSFGVRTKTRASSV